MGNICGKTSSETDNFSQPGRVVGSAPPSSASPKTAPVPKKVGGPARTLGGGTGNNSSSGGGGGGDGSGTSAADARRRAAEAAEARANAANKSGGKLAQKVMENKRKSHNNNLADASRETTQAREADEAARARTWD